jgi:chromate reductase
MAITPQFHEPPYAVGYFVGSLSKDSINRALANALIRLAPAELEFSEIVIRDLPLYNRDYDADYPRVALDFKESIAACDALLFVTPEYNRSIPGALKNAIDWASRPWGQNVISRRASGIVGASGGSIGTALAQQSLRGVLAFCDAPQMTSPEVYIHMTPGLITPEGEITNEATERFLRDYIEQFADFVARVLTVVPRAAG